MLPSWDQSEGVITKPGGECEASMYLHDRSSSWQQPAAAGSMSVVKCALRIQYFIESSWIAHMAVFTSRQCTNWFFIWWNGMEGLHISKYAVNDASTNINDLPPAFTNKTIHGTKSETHVLTCEPWSPHTCWSCDYVRTVRAHDGNWLLHSGCTGDVDILLHRPS